MGNSQTTGPLKEDLSFLAQHSQDVARNVLEKYFALDLEFGIGAVDLKKLLCEAGMEPSDDQVKTIMTTFPNENMLNALDFIEGFGVLVKGELVEKAGFAFDVFDFQQQGQISFDELTIMFMSVARGTAILAGLPVKTDVDDEDIASRVRDEFGLTEGSESDITRDIFVKWTADKWSDTGKELDANSLLSFVTCSEEQVVDKLPVDDGKSEEKKHSTSKDKKDLEVIDVKKDSDQSGESKSGLVIAEGSKVESKKNDIGVSEEENGMEGEGKTNNDSAECSTTEAGGDDGNEKNEVIAHEIENGKAKEEGKEEQETEGAKEEKEIEVAKSDEVNSEENASDAETKMVDEQGSASEENETISTPIDETVEANKEATPPVEEDKKENSVQPDEAVDENKIEEVVVESEELANAPVEGEKYSTAEESATPDASKTESKTDPPTTETMASEGTPEAKAVSESENKPEAESNTGVKEEKASTAPAEKAENGEETAKESDDTEAPSVPEKATESEDNTEKKKEEGVNNKEENTSAVREEDETKSLNESATTDVKKEDSGASASESGEIEVVSEKEEEKGQEKNTSEASQDKVVGDDVPAATETDEKACDVDAPNETTTETKEEVNEGKKNETDVATSKEEEGKEEMNQSNSQKEVSEEVEKVELADDDAKPPAAASDEQATVA